MTYLQSKPITPSAKGQQQQQQQQQEQQQLSPEKSKIDPGKIVEGVKKVQQGSRAVHATLAALNK